MKIQKGHYVPKELITSEAVHEAVVKCFVAAGFAKDSDYGNMPEPGCFSGLGVDWKTKSLCWVCKGEPLTIQQLLTAENGLIWPDWAECIDTDGKAVWFHGRRTHELIAGEIGSGPVIMTLATRQPKEKEVVEQCLIDEFIIKQSGVWPNVDAAKSIKEIGEFRSDSFNEITDIRVIGLGWIGVDNFCCWAKHLGYISGYRWGLEYPTDGERPDLADDVLISVAGLMINGNWYMHEFTKLTVDWRDAIKFKVIDPRYKPEDTSYLNASTQDQILTHSWHERGELPPVGAKCESYDFSHSQWVKVKTLDAETGSKELACVTVDEDGTYGRLFWGCTFRPILTEREKVIEAAVMAVESNNSPSESIYDTLYNAGMLVLPPKKSDTED